MSRTPVVGLVCQGLAELAGTVADDNINDDGFLAVLLFELLYDNFLEVGCQFGGHEVDGAAAEAAAHDA